MWCFRGEPTSSGEIILKRLHWRQNSRVRFQRWPRAVATLATVALGASLMALPIHATDVPIFPERQVKALFLFNFAKYVDWPATAFPDTNAPITIGIMGEDRLDDSLRYAVEGKTVNGRPFVIKHLAADSELSGCHILFISESEASRMGAILDKARALPVLTVGENEPFARNGGVITFVLRNGNVRLDIDLAAAKKAGLTISSRLLAVADVVKGKTN
jgi:hypothetical protein